MPDSGVRAAPHANPFQSILLAFPVALFPSGLVADITYLRSEVIQWTNFAQWLIAGAVLFSGLLLAWALVSLLVGRARRSQGRGLIYLIVVAGMFGGGLLNAFQHSKDGWASVGSFGLVLSIVCTVLAFVAAFLAQSRTTIREVRS